MKHRNRMLPLLALALCIGAGCSGRNRSPRTESRPFTLEVLATTMTQIVVQWRNEPESTSSFELERATDASFTQNLKLYSFDRDTFLFSDTDREPLSKRRFTGDKREPLLDPETTYYYRAKAVIGDADPKLSNTVKARVSGPVRGLEGDLWADVVLGVSGFGENVPYHPTRHGVYNPGGVLIDKTVQPNRMYIADCSNNRIVGFESTSPKDGADIVFGQPDFNSSSGNGDSCAQLFPYGRPAGAATLCLMLPTQISVGETVVRMNMTVDDKGNLYVTDIFNNRILKYNDPFGTDTTADAVWGQADFAGNEPNRGMANPDSNTLHFAHRGDVTFDADGNLWVADCGNHRVLRFPKNHQTDVIASEADVVLGQADFSTNGDYGRNRNLAQMCYPRAIEFDSKGRLYVGDGLTNAYDRRILVFEPPFKSGMSAARNMPVPMELEINPDPNRRPAIAISSLVRDINPDRMWFEKNDSFTSELVDLKAGKSVTSVLCEQSSGIDVDSDGNLYTVHKWAGVFRFPASSWSLPWSERRKLVENVLVKGNTPTAGSMGGILGITAFRDQLVIAENSRLLIWNKFNVNKIRNGEPADDVFGEKDFSTMSYRDYFSSLQTDKSGRLWVSRRVGRLSHHVLEAFEYPLTRDSKPVKQITLMRGDENVLPVRGGGAMHTVAADFIDFAVVGTGDKIWVADRTASRVFRINNVDGLEDPEGEPYVDIVLGQSNLTDVEVHGGKEGTRPRTLAWSYNIGITPQGRLLISDNGGECGTNQRILMYDAKRFPDNPEKCLFPDDIGDPDSVIGTGGELDVPGSVTKDPICSPFEVGISSRGTIVAGMNGYSAQRFPLVYLDPEKSTLPQMALGDFTGYPMACFIDEEGNVYIGDWNWCRVLVYKRPFKKIRY